MWNVEHVILVAGASCVGKTTFLKKLMGPSPPCLPKGLRPPDLSKFSVVNAIDLMKPTHAVARPRRIVLHYDIFRPITFFESEDFDVDPVLKLLRFVPESAVLTLWDDPNLLRERSVTRRRNLWKKLARTSSFRKPRANLQEFNGARTRRNRMRPWLADGDRLWHLYDMWFDFVRAAGVDKHWIVKPSDDMAYSSLGKGKPDSPLWPVGPDRTAMVRSGETSSRLADSGLIAENDEGDR